MTPAHHCKLQCTRAGLSAAIPELRLRTRLNTCRLISVTVFKQPCISRESFSGTWAVASCTAPRCCRSAALREEDNQATSMPCLAPALGEDVQWDVLGIGQAMVDFAAAVDDTFLEQLGVEKGGRRIITVEERAKVLELLDGSAYQISAGGSLANTLANLGRLGTADLSMSSGIRQSLRIASASIVGSDALGSFHIAQQSNAGVRTLSQPLPDSSTGTVIVLTTPDANRTFLSYLGTSQELELAPEVTASIRQSRLVALEGYLWEMPNAAASIAQVTELAHASGAVVALTAGDANVVERHREEIWNLLHKGLDILFANRSEAAALLQCNCTAEEAALTLGPHCDVVVVTDGANGSCISAMGRLQVIPPFWASSKPIDTCGAGDAYAAGLIYGWLSGMEPSSMGRCGARVASAVIAKHGGALTASEAEEVVDALTFSCPGTLDFINNKARFPR